MVFSVEHCKKSLDFALAGDMRVWMKAVTQTVAVRLAHILV